MTRCRVCNLPFTVTAAGLIRWHGARGTAGCPGAGRPPARPKVPLACLQGAHTDTCGHLEAVSDDDPHDWPAAAVEPLRDALHPPGDQLAITVGLPPEDRARVIAAHMILDPYAAGGILETVAQVIHERTRT